MPDGPTSCTVFPKASRTGLAFSNASSLPPQKTVSRPSSAACWPRTTGVSRRPSPLALQAASNSCAVLGEHELATHMTAPLLSRSASPESSTTSRTCLSVATITTTTSASAPTSAGEPTTLMPTSLALALASSETSYPATAKPFLTICIAMGWPIIAPRPIIPAFFTVMNSLPSYFSILNAGAVKPFATSPLRPHRPPKRRRP